MNDFRLGFMVIPAKTIQPIAPEGPGAAVATVMFKWLGRVRTESPPHINPLIIVVWLLVIPLPVRAEPAIAAESEAWGCARMVRAMPWEVGREVEMPCREVLAAISRPLLRTPLDVTRLAKSSQAEAALILGEPFHSYSDDQEEVAFYQEKAMVAVYYQKTTGRPNRILIMSLVGLKNIYEIPSFLGLEADSAPLSGPAGPFWNNVGAFKQIEAHYPDYKLNGELIYTVILHIDQAPVIDIAEIMNSKK